MRNCWTNAIPKSRSETLYSTSQVIKTMDPLYFRMGVSENLESLAQDGQLYEYSGEYYQMNDLEEMLDEIEAE